jgi:hypothetical protein
MERTVLLEHLQTARRHADDGRAIIERQKRAIASLAAAGIDTSDAERILQTLEETQTCHLSDMQKILNELDDAGLAVTADPDLSPAPGAGD